MVMQSSGFLVKTLGFLLSEYFLGFSILYPMEKVSPHTRYGELVAHTGDKLVISFKKQGQKHNLKTPLSLLIIRPLSLL